MKVLVIGASPKHDRYSYLAVQSLTRHGHEVIALGSRPSNEEFEIISGKPELEEIDTVTLYLNPRRQEEYYNYVVGLKPRRVIFNPGTENPEFESLLKQNGILPDQACTLVLLSTEQFEN